MLFFVLKNAAQRTSQRLKWICGARVLMLAFSLVVILFSWFSSIGSVLERLVLKNAAQRTSQHVK